MEKTPLSAMTPSTASDVDSDQENLPGEEEPMWQGSSQAHWGACYWQSIDNDWNVGLANRQSSKFCWAATNVLQAIKANCDDLLDVSCCSGATLALLYFAIISIAKSVSNLPYEQRLTESSSDACLSHRGVFWCVACCMLQLHWRAVCISSIFCLIKVRSRVRFLVQLRCKRGAHKPPAT